MAPQPSRYKVFGRKFPQIWRSTGMLGGQREIMMMGSQLERYYRGQRRVWGTTWDWYNCYRLDSELTFLYPRKVRSIAASRWAEQIHSAERLAILIQSTLVRIHTLAFFAKYVTMRPAESWHAWSVLKRNLHQPLKTRLLVEKFSPLVALTLPYGLPLFQGKICISVHRWCYRLSDFVLQLDLQIFPVVSAKPADGELKLASKETGSFTRHVSQ